MSAYARSGWLVALSALIGLSFVAYAAPAAEDEKPAATDAKVAKAETSEAKVQLAAKPEAAEAKKEKTKASIASLVLKNSYPEGVAAAGMFGEIEPNLKDLTDRLEKARKDDKISGIVLHFRNPELGRGKVDELRAAIERTRKGGKKVYASLQSAMASDYMLATACDEIIMPESGILMIPGVRADLTYFKGVFDNLGIKADFIQIGDYKGAAEPFTRTAMSPEFRKQFESVIDDYYDQLISTISETRKIDRDRVKQLLDDGIFTAERAKSVGLIDRVTYDDQLPKDIADQLKTDEVSMIKDYGKKEMDVDFSGIGGMVKMMEMMMGGGPAKRASRNKKIAVVYAVGPIMEGESEGGFMSGPSVGSDTIVKALREAEDDATCVGIVLRVDSPGGSAIASDMIWRQIVGSKKNVVASMGDIAASGGYYISMGAKKIFAEPGTLTGSIGVVGGKVALKGLFDKVGISHDSISRGQNSGMFVATEVFSPTERDALYRMMNDTYDQFTRKAADGRKMDLAKMRDLAQGKLYSGRMAAKVNLVDKVGTLEDAIAESKKLAGLKEDDKVEIMVLPKPRNIFEVLFGGPSAQSKISSPLQAIAPELAGPLAEVEVLRKLFAKPVVAILPFKVEIK